MIKEAIIVCPGDRSVGIPDATFTLGPDLPIESEDRNEFRQELIDLFFKYMGTVPCVVFSDEIPKESGDD